jgi:hypothetical protein
VPKPNSASVQICRVCRRGRGLSGMDLSCRLEHSMSAFDWTPVGYESPYGDFAPPLRHQSQVMSVGPRLAGYEPD